MSMCNPQQNHFSSKCIPQLMIYFLRMVHLKTQLRQVSRDRNCATLKGRTGRSVDDTTPNKEPEQEMRVAKDNKATKPSFKAATKNC